MEKPHKKLPIEIAIQMAGGISAMANALGVSAPTVHQWKSNKHSRPIPAARCPDIERITNGAVTCEELRPDLADKWTYLRGTKRGTNKKAT
jgi:DNA-binding transcriptional regulator YdaS (Cro superfamily)